MKNTMRTRLAALLAAVALVGVCALSDSHAKANEATTVQPSQKLALKSGGPAVAAPVFQNSSFANNYGRVTRLYPSPNGMFFSLGGRKLLNEVKTDMNPKDGYYFIPLSHPNYNSLVALLYLCAEHDYILKVRTQDALNANGHAEVVYLVKDFNRN